MNNKVLIKLIVPEIDTTYDVFIPVNEVVWKIKKMLIKIVNDVANINFNLQNDYILLNKSTSRIYNNNEIVIDTDIRNATELMIFCK